MESSVLGFLNTLSFNYLFSDPTVAFARESVCSRVDSPPLSGVPEPGTLSLRCFGHAALDMSRRGKV